MSARKTDGAARNLHSLPRILFKLKSATHCIMKDVGLTVSINLSELPVFLNGKDFAFGNSMLDLVSIVATIGFFLISLAYVKGCTKL